MDIQSHTTILGPAPETQLGTLVETEIAGWIRAAHLGEYRIVQTIIALEGDNPASLAATVTVRYRSMQEQEAVS